MNFLRSVREEMKLVSWPSKKQLRHDSLVVIETAIIFCFDVFHHGYSDSSTDQFDHSLVANSKKACYTI